MKVSVLIVTYNHAEYIASAINSVLMQEVSFDYEIVIGEDASTDGTRAIVLEFEKEYPDKIRALLRDPVDAETDRAAGVGGKGGFVKGLQACKGQYVALLDGDDYWTDPHKLQKQVDFLDSHSDFAICCHNVSMLFEDRSIEPANLFPPDQKEISTIEDLFFSNVIPTCSVLFRRGLFAELPDWFYTMKIGDWPIHILNAQHGGIRYFPEAMAVYRVHQGGFWSGWTPVGRGLEVIRMLDHVDAYLGFEYKKQIRAGKAAWYYRLAETSHIQGDRVNARIFLKKYFSLGGLKIRMEVLSLLLRMETPALYKRLITLRDFVRSAASNKHYEHLY